MHTDITEYFFKLLAASLNTDKPLPTEKLSGREWEQLYEIAQRQNMTALLTTGIERLDKDFRPPKSLMLQWLITTETIRRRNIMMNEATAQVQKKLNEDGFRSCLLKGQGVATYYPDPAKRISGDIDLWVECDRKVFTAYIKKIHPDCEIKYRDIDVFIANRIEVEFHLMPAIFYNFVRNRRLQRFFKVCKEEQFANFVSVGAEKLICTPTQSFNRIYLIIHLFNHFLFEGIGLRQFVDYYFLLRNGATREERNQEIATLRSLGLLKFTEAVMYVLLRCFNMDEKHLLVKVDEKYGQFLLKEILIGGNFGKYDPRYKVVKPYTFAAFKQHVTRNLRFVRLFPVEILSAPIFKIWHYYYYKKTNR